MLGINKADVATDITELGKSGGLGGSGNPGWL